jgi:hypothetical protein
VGGSGVGRGLGPSRGSTSNKFGLDETAKGAEGKSKVARNWGELARKGVVKGHGREEKATYRAFRIITAYYYMGATNENQINTFGSNNSNNGPHPRP